MTQPQPNDVYCDPIREAWRPFSELCYKLAGDPCLIPFKDGQPDWEGATRESLTKIAHWSDITEDDIPRLAILTDSFSRFIGDGEDASILTLWRDGTPEVRQIDGDPCEAALDVVTDVVNRNSDALVDLPAEKDESSPDLVPANDNEKPSPASITSWGKLSLTWFDEIGTEAKKEEIIKGMLGAGEFTVASGLPGSGKSVILTDAACHVAAGKEWHGRKVKPGLVVYVAAERKKLTERRMLAFRKHHGVGSIPLLVVGGLIDLTTGTVHAKLIADVVKAAEKACGYKCVWIIIDTLTRTFGPGDQHQSKDMTKYVLSCDTIVAETGAHVTVIHHTAWSGERGKGAIDLDGAVDASFMVKKQASSYVIECDGTNDGEEGEICRFRMEGVQVGVDEEGEPVMAPVVVPAEGAAQKLFASHKKHTANALRVLIEGSAEQGGMSEEEWRAAFYALDPGAKPDTLRTRFRRARIDLLDDGSIINEDGIFRPAPSGTDGTCPANVTCPDNETGN